MEEEKRKEKREKLIEKMERMSAAHEEERKQMEIEIASLEPSILREYVMMFECTHPSINDYIRVEQIHTTRFDHHFTSNTTKMVLTLE